MKLLFIFNKLDNRNGIVNEQKFRHASHIISVVEPNNLTDKLYINRR